MTEEGKTALTDFLNLTSDYLLDGHTRFHKANEPVEQPKADNPAIPLAYLVEEPGENFEDNDIQAPAYSLDGSSGPAGTADSIETVAAEISACRACGLEATRTHVVPGEGAAQPLVMVIGEGPGADEDAQGRPFVGRAGQLLDKMLASIGLYRDKNCYIANMVKCRPPGNRDPAPDEVAACSAYLERQILLLRPKLILCVGRVASQNLLKTVKGINALRGEFAELRISPAAEFELDESSDNALSEETVIPVLPTFHPSALLRDESLKRPAWEDLKLLRAKLDSMNGDAQEPHARHRACSSGEGDTACPPENLSHARIRYDGG